MKIYLAARYSRREELLRYASDLAELNHQVTSRWIEGSHQVSDAGLSEEGSVEERTRFAMEDWLDVCAAETVISFTEQPRSELTKASRGGRHVEFGAALAMHKRCIVVGPRENVFHCLPQVIVYPTWNEALSYLAVQR